MLQPQNHFEYYVLVRSIRLDIHPKEVMEDQVGQNLVIRNAQEKIAKDVSQSCQKISQISLEKEKPL